LIIVYPAMTKYLETVPELKNSDYKTEDYEGKNIPCFEVCLKFYVIFKIIY